MSKIRAIKDVILVCREEHDDKTASGIILPGQDIPTGSGIVISVGADVKEVEVGNKVIFGKLDGHDTTIDDKAHVWLRDFNIYGVYDE